MHQAVAHSLSDLLRTLGLGVALAAAVSCQPDQKSAAGGKQTARDGSAPARIVAPADQALVERGAGAWTLSTSGTCSPDGLRIAVNITDAQINNWLDSRGFTGAKRNTARIFAVAMRDYGGIVLETGCYGIGMETDGLFDTRPGGSRDIWASLRYDTVRLLHWDGVAWTDMGLSTAAVTDSNGRIGSSPSGASSQI